MVRLNPLSARPARPSRTRGAQIQVPPARRVAPPALTATGPNRHRVMTGAASGTTRPAMAANRHPPGSDRHPYIGPSLPRSALTSARPVRSGALHQLSVVPGRDGPRIHPGTSTPASGSHGFGVVRAIPASGYAECDGTIPSADPAIVAIQLGNVVIGGFLTGPAGPLPVLTGDPATETHRAVTQGCPGHATDTETSADTSFGGCAARGPLVILKYGWTAG